MPTQFAKVNAGLTMYPIVATSQLTREAFFSAEAPNTIVDATHRELQNESYVSYLQMFATRPRPRLVATPMKVVAAGLDTIFSVAEQRRLAAAYGTDLVVVEGSGHDIMLDPLGRPALSLVLDWAAGL